MFRHQKAEELYAYCNFYLYAPELPVSDFRRKFNSLFSAAEKARGFTKREAAAFKTVHDAVTAEVPTANDVHASIGECNLMLSKHRRKGFADEGAMRELNQLAELIVDAYMSDKGNRVSGK